MNRVRVLQVLRAISIIPLAYVLEAAADLVGNGTLENHSLFSGDGIRHPESVAVYFVVAALMVLIYRTQRR